MSTCRSCGAFIVWEVTKAGRRIPLDPGDVERGNLMIDDDGKVVTHDGLGDRPRRITHFVTCPDGKKHRKTTGGGGDVNTNGVPARIVRGEKVKQRVTDCLGNMGQDGAWAERDLFVAYALKTAKEEGMRVWVGTPEQQLRSAAHSLATLFGENVSEQWDSRKGTNAHWVLDVWEKACDGWFRSERDPTKLIPNTTLQMAIASPRPLSARLLDAYTKRNADAFVDALAEIEARGL